VHTAVKFRNQVLQKVPGAVLADAELWIPQSWDLCSEHSPAVGQQVWFFP
jgi:hypothetical protein